MGDFNIDLLKEIEEKQVLLNQVVQDYNPLVSEWSTHIDGGCIDHIYTRKTLYDDTNILKYSVNLSDHDVLKLEISI